MVYAEGIVGTGCDPLFIFSFDNSSTYYVCTIILLHYRIDGETASVCSIRVTGIIDEVSLSTNMIWTTP